MYDVENGADEVMDPVAKEEQNVARLQLFQAMLSDRRKEAVTARAASGVERRWLDDLDSYLGRDAGTQRMNVMDAARGEAAAAVRRTAQDSTAGKRSTVFVQLTRQKTNTASARAADMLYPTDDKNWGIKPTPVPELMDAAKTGGETDYKDPQTGGPLQHPKSGTGPDNPPRNVTLADLALEQMADAQSKSEAMEKEIDDQLTECQYNYEGRKVIQDAAMYGTGVMKGPAVINRTAKKWSKVTDPKSGQSVQMLQVMQVMKPQTYHVDLWNFYPDPACGDDIQSGAYVFEREFMPGRDLAKMAKVQGYNKQAIAQCLQEGPQHLHAEGSYTDNMRGGDLAYSQQGTYNDKRFEVWTYTGDVDREDLEAAGVKLDDNWEAYLTTYSAVIVMCNERIIKAILNPMDTGDFPYDVFNWERVALSPFGVGIPYLMRYAQRTLNAAWRAMLDNMALSSGPQIIMNRKLVTPADGKWELTARKLWWMTDGDDVQKAFWVFTIPSMQQEIANIIKIAQEFADLETSLPQIAQGEKGSAPDTLGATAMLMNSAGTVLRRIAKQYDDQITRPHIRRYYDWNMQYNTKEEIKGDFEVDARGSSVCVVRDEQQQGVMNLLVTAKDPDYGIYVDKQKLFRKSLEMQHLTPDDVMKTPEQIAAAEKAQAQAAPQDPRIEAAQISAASAEKIAAMKGKSEQAYADTQASMARDSHAAAMGELQVKREIAIMNYATQERMQLVEVKAQLAEMVMNHANTHSLANAERMTTAAQNSGPPEDATPAMNPDAELTA